MSDENLAQRVTQIFPRQTMQEWEAETRIGLDQFATQVEKDSYLPRLRAVAFIVRTIDASRFTAQGAYPSEFLIYNDLLIMASVTRKDAPELTIEPVDSFIKEHLWIWELEELLEDQPKYPFDQS